MAIIGIYTVRYSASEQQPKSGYSKQTGRKIFFLPINSDMVFRAQADSVSDNFFK
jgi:hypothetical protein